jgi:hypothetical protein
MGIATAYAGVLSDAPPPPLELQIVQNDPAKTAIGIHIVNHADHAVMIQRGIELDQVNGFKWVARMQIQAVADCTAYDQSQSLYAPVRIEAGGTLDIAPWHGWSCGSQCPEACSKSAPMGGGDYRFVAVTAEGQRIPSPGFKLP